MFKAIKKYDVNNPNGASFFTYSIFWIRAEINNFLWKGDSLIHVPQRKLGIVKFDIFDIEKVNFKMKVEEDGDE